MATSLFIIDTVDLSQIELQFIPRELEFSPDSKIEAVVSPGRNNPFYHFSGSEDSLKFQIDWHAMDNDRKDVITKCRWLESLSKADGYASGLHPIKLVWGDLMNKETVWIVKQALYKVSLFDKVFGMLPKQAYQDVVLVRLATYNRTINDIRNNLDIDSSKLAI